MDYLHNLTCVIDDEKCNIIKPSPVIKMYGTDSRTGRKISDYDRSILKDGFKRICKTFDGNMKTCCSKSFDGSNLDDSTQKFIDNLKNKYPSVRINKLRGEVNTIDLSTVKISDDNQEGWIPMNTNIICKISKAQILPTNNNNVFKAINIVRDCYTDSCTETEQDITLDNILGTQYVKEKLEYSYYDDMKVVEYIKENNIDLIKEYLRKYNSVDHILSHNDYRYRLIHIASANGKEDVVNMLISLNADINIIDKNGNTPIHLAAENGHVSIVNNLVNQGANTETLNVNGETAMFPAVRSGNVGLLRTMYNNNHGLFVKDNNNNNLIHHTIKHTKVNKSNIARFLIKYGVSLDEMNKDGLYPMDLAHNALNKLNKCNNNSNNSNNSNNNLKTVKTETLTKVKHLDDKSHRKEVQELLTLISDISRTHHKQVYGLEEATYQGPVSKTVPIDYQTHECVGPALDIHLSEKECLEGGGQMVELKEHSTIAKTSYYGHSKSSIDKIDNKDLYYPKEKYNDSYNPNNSDLATFNEKIRKDLKLNNNNNNNNPICEGFVNNNTMIAGMPLINFVLIIIVSLVIILLVSKK